MGGVGVFEEQVGRFRYFGVSNLIECFVFVNGGDFTT